ncbi:MAG: GNAT family N-acetyltransferase [Methanomicrobiales archaeon]|nr:GNAT family N-acetyltransferase [Methanomicrobiales archaeon]
MTDNLLKQGELTADDTQPDDIRILSVRAWNTEEIIALYQNAGWWHSGYLVTDIPRILEGSFSFVIAVDTRTGTAVGMGRILSDGVSDAYIQDLIVHSEYRRKGIGKKILLHLLSICATVKIDWIGLIAEHGAEDFYEELGFSRMGGYTPMIYHRKG